MNFKTSKLIDRDVDMKNGSDLRDIADVSISPNDYIEDDALHDGDAMGAISDGIAFGLLLAQKRDRLRKKNPKTDIYLSTYNDAMGECELYFVGTVISIRKRLSKLQNTNI